VVGFCVDRGSGLSHPLRQSERHWACFLSVHFESVQQSERQSSRHDAAIADGGVKMTGTAMRAINSDEIKNCFIV